MDNANQDGSAATDNKVSDQNQTDSSQTTDLSKADMVAYETHKRLLGEKKKLQAMYDELKVANNKSNEEKLAAEGKKDELLEAYKKRISEMEGKVNEFAYSSVSNAVRLKAKDMGCVDDDALVKLIDLSTLSVGEGFTVDTEEVKTMLENLKKEKSYLFKPVNPNVNNSMPNANPNLEGGKVDFSKMTKDELVAYGNKHGL